MQSESVPSPLSELFLPDPSGDRSGSSNSSSPAEVDRFERYLQSARQSVSADQALPTMARRDDRATGARPDARRDPIDRSESAAAARARRPERTRSDDRADTANARDDRAGDGDDRTTDRAERADRPRSTDKAEADGKAEAAGDDDRTEATEAMSGDERSRATEEGAGNEQAIDGEAEAAVELRAALGTLIEDALVDGAGDTTETEVDGEAVAGADGVTELEIDDEDEAVEQATDADDDAIVLTANLERSAEQVAAMASTDNRSATDTTASDTAEADDELAVSAASSDGAASAGESEHPTDETTIDITDEAIESGETDGGAPTDAAADQPDADAGRAATSDRPTTTDGPDVAPVVQAATTQTARTVETSGNQVSGAESVSGPSAVRNRPAPTTTAATQNAEAPVADGEAGDPLWLQVRRAMGSLRTLRNGEQQLTIRLRPAELGSVVVRVNAGEHGTRVSLLADSAVAATQLGQQRQQLINELEQNGLAGVAVDISNGQNPGNPESANPDGERGGEGGANGAATGAAAALAGATTATLPRAGGRGRRSGGGSGGLVDVDL